MRKKTTRRVKKSVNEERRERDQGLVLRETFGNTGTGAGKRIMERIQRGDN